MFTAKLNEVLASKKSFIEDPVIYQSLLVSLIILIIHCAVLYIKIKPSSTRILLHYNVLYGADFIGSSRLIYAIPLIALLFFILNIFIASWFYHKEKLAAYFLSSASVVVQLIFMVATFVLISVNGS